jgi:hypothetical protein
MLIKGYAICEFWVQKHAQCERAGNIETTRVQKDRPHKGFKDVREKLHMFAFHLIQIKLDRIFFRWFIEERTELL